MPPHPRWERLSRWIATGIDPDDHAHVEVSAPDLARFRLQNLRAGRSGIRWLAVLNLLSLIVFWPTDRLFLAGTPGAVDTMWKGRAVACALATLVLLASRLPDRFTELVAWIAGTGAVAIVGSTLGRIGAPNTTWFHTLDWFLLMGLFLWQRPVQRLVSTSAIALVALAAFFLSNPAHLRDPMVGPAVVYFTYVWLLSVLLGLYVDRMRARVFLLGLELSRREERLVRTVSAQTARIEALGERLETLRDEERAHLAHELHDEMGQVLTGMRAMIRVAQSRAGAQVRQELEELAKLLVYATATLRDLLVRLRPPLLDELGLPTAAEWLVRRSGVLSSLSCTLAIRDREALERLPPEASLVAWRFLQEALTNVSRHARARGVRVSLGLAGEAVEIAVVDDGVGFDPRAVGRAPGHLGLAGMMERAARAGATLTVRSAPGEGTDLALRLPRGAVEEAR